MRLDLFALALYFIPFDNLFFAPSSGWATIAPIIFFLYVCINFKQLISAIPQKMMAIAVALILMQVILLGWNGFNTATLLDSIETLVLGLSFYLALILRYHLFKKDITLDGRVLYKGYFLGFLYGAIRLVCMTFFKGLLPAFLFLEKRSSDRLAFSFTEPSFIGMHVFGVIFLFSCLVKNERLTKKFIRLGCCYLALGILARSSTRCIIDVAFFLALLLVRSILLEAKHLARNMALLIGGLAGIVAAISLSPRLQAIIEGGVNADASGASRWFRINAFLHGCINEPLTALLGTGLGNTKNLFQAGFYQALSQYKNDYMVEVLALKKAESIESLFCMPVKIISDFGLLIFLLGVVTLTAKYLSNKNDIFVLIMSFWLYIQFDSYAFYTLWLLLYITNYCRGKDKIKSYFGYLSNPKTLLR